MPIRARFRALTANSKQVKTDRLVAGAKSTQRNWANKAIKRLQQYPPEIGGSRYARTGELGRNWKVEGPSELASGITTRIVNNTDYAIYVYGDETGSGQVRVHQGRWVTIPEAIDREGYIDDLRKVVRDAIQ